MAKLVDALPSGGSVRKDVLVRIQSRAQIINYGQLYYSKKNNLKLFNIADRFLLGNDYQNN